MSRGFLSALGGVAMTLFAWYGPWEWPAWPAFAVIELVFAHNGFAELPYAQRAIAVTFLIAVNVTAWAVLMRVLLTFTDRLRVRGAAARRA